MPRTPGKRGFPSTSVRPAARGERPRRGRAPREAALCAQGGRHWRRRAARPASQTGPERYERAALARRWLGRRETPRPRREAPPTHPSGRAPQACSSAATSAPATPTDERPPAVPNADSPPQDRVGPPQTAFSGQRLAGIAPQPIHHEKRLVLGRCTSKVTAAVARRRSHRPTISSG